MRDIAWAAGLFEGEGSWFASKNHQKARGGIPLLTFHMALGMSDKDVVDSFCQVAECGFVQSLKKDERYKNAKPMFRWVGRGQKALNFANKLLPYMGERRTVKFYEILAELEKNKKDRDAIPRITKFSDEKIQFARELYATGGFTQAEVASLTGISLGYIPQVLNGRKR